MSNKQFNRMKTAPNQPRQVPSHAKAILNANKASKKPFRIKPIGLKELKHH